MLAGLPLQFFDLLGYQSILDLAVDVSDKKPAIALWNRLAGTVSIILGLGRFKTGRPPLRRGIIKVNLAFSDDMKKPVYDFIIDAADWLSQGVPAKIVETEFSHRGWFISRARVKGAQMKREL